MNDAPVTDAGLKASDIQPADRDALLTTAKRLTKRSGRAPTFSVRTGCTLEYTKSLIDAQGGWAR